jgi:hypothetical protein
MNTVAIAKLNALSPSLAFEAKTKIEKKRELPIKGTILVSEGAVVQAEDIVANAEMQGELVLLKVSEKLGIHPSELGATLLVKLGEKVSQGQVICKHSGLFGLLSSRFLSPLNGTIEFISEATGHITIRSQSKTVNVRAHVPGRVTKLEDSKAVWIESNVAFAQGIFGLGGERRGKLKLVSKEDNQVINAEDLPDDLQDCVILAKYQLAATTYGVLSEKGVRGVIVGSIDDNQLETILGYQLGIAITGEEKISFTVVVTEGFGSISMSKRIFELLQSFEGKMVSIDGTTQIRAGAVRPEIIVPLDSNTEVMSIPQPKSLEVGAHVRIIRYPFFGVEGVIEELPVKPEKLSSGSYARVLKIKLASGESITVPRVNIELM